MLPISFIATSPVRVNGINGLWLSSDEVTGVGLKANNAANTYSVILPKELPASPLNQFLGLESIVGNEATSNWLPASNKIPWSVAVPGSNYESISEYTSLSLALSDAANTGQQVSILMFPGEHDATPNVQIPFGVDLLGWGGNVSIIRGEIQIVGPYALPTRFWYIYNLGLTNTNKGVSTLSMSNNGVTIGNRGALLVENCQLSGDITIENADGGNMSFHQCLVDSETMCFTGSNGGSTTLFDCTVLPAAGGGVADMTNQRFLTYWSTFFNGPNNTSIFTRGGEFRSVSCFYNIDEIVCQDGDFVFDSCYSDTNSLRFESTIAPSNSIAIISSFLRNLTPTGNLIANVDSSTVTNMISNSGYRVNVRNSSLYDINLAANSSQTNDFRMFSSIVSNLSILRDTLGAINIIGCDLMNNLSIQTNNSTSVNLAQSYLEHLDISSPNGAIQLGVIDNYFKGSGPLFTLDMNPSDSPLFLQNIFDISATSVLDSSSVGLTILTQNNQAPLGTTWSATTASPGWITL